MAFWTLSDCRSLAKATPLSSTALALGRGLTPSGQGEERGGERNERKERNEELAGDRVGAAKRVPASHLLLKREL